MTGLHRKTRILESSSGTGYSTGQDTSALRKDTTYIDKLTACMIRIGDMYDAQYVMDSPLVELVCFMIKEMSIEEVLHSESYATALFSLFGMMQQFGQANNVEEDILLKLHEFKTILVIECGLEKITIPIEIIGKAMERTTSRTQDSGDVKSCGCFLEPVTTVDTFRSHTYMTSTPSSSSYPSDGASTGAFMGAEITSAATIKRMRIELSTLRSSLPPSIRFMVLEENYSYCKFLITGPADTPYEGGYFLFDMMLPSDYPAQSPKVHFLTTGSGRVRFNPNLYNNGKVCLSLLGTWSGEAW